MLDPSCFLTHPPTLVVASGIGAASAGALVLMAVGAIAMPNLAKLLRIPVAVAEIGYGLLLGESVFGLVGEDRFIEFLAEVGFAFFMFLAGLEIDFRGASLRGVKRGGLMLGLSALAYGIVFAFGTALGWPIWVSLAAGATSVGLLVAVVRETGVGGTPLANLMLGQAAIGEALTIFLLSVMTISQLTEGGGALLLGVLKLLGLVVAMLSVLLVLRALLWWYPDPFVRMVSHDDPSEFGMRVGIGLMFAFLGLSLLADVEPFLGAFIAGVCLAFVIREKGALEHKLGSMAYGFFVPIFFIDVGIRLDMSVGLIVDNASFIALVVVVMLVAKLVPSAWYLRRGLAPRSVLAMSGLLAAPLTLVIAIIGIAHRLNAVSTQLASVVIAAGILASLLYPSMARQLLRGPARVTER